jgi:hypothetical protein
VESKLRLVISQGIFFYVGGETVKNFNSNSLSDTMIGWPEADER